MRLLPGLVLVISLGSATSVEARLFWQTYGSTVPAADGAGCTWNWNQDYFVPRHPSSCRYGLFSPCKSSCTVSPACRGCHPWYPGYCTIYGPCHYCRRNHVYAAYCGCQPIPPYGRHGCRAKPRGCAAGGDCWGIVGSRPLAAPDQWAPLHHVEPTHFDILGSIPVEGGDLLTRSDFSQLGDDRGGQLPLQPQTALPLLQGLPSLGLPKAGQFTQPLTRP